ncbi:hypothetical protein BUZ57_08190 [Staphylococcus hyicus]|uniref:Uncharacterized protein n=1 Tax=Staphylococcus hyicus TaxID=1284 RepID=A0A418JHZ6_STAHY|nr:hypothetical protein [Staphylococcus hyicus]NJH82150.1 hypothetical protein [Staphylococcus hyicus]RIO45025.1 hypothetical protein BUZ57_08190 [Staphylococcus hyicus]
MQLLKYAKIALLIVILAEEIRNARNYKKAIGKPFTRRFTPEDSNGFSDVTKKSIKETAQCLSN